MNTECKKQHMVPVKYQMAWCDCHGEALYKTRTGCRHSPPKSQQQKKYAYKFTDITLDDFRFINMSKIDKKTAESGLGTEIAI